jgi:hypothetical protein
MPLRFAALCAWFLLAASPALASPILSIDAPATYTPGGSVDFTVRLSGATDLASYNIRILISDATGSLPGGSAGAHFWLVDLLANTDDPLNPNDLNIATRPAGAAYVFNANSDVTTRQSAEFAFPDYGVALGDYSYDGALTDPFYTVATDPDKQVLATFRVATGASFHGTLRLAVDTSSGALELDDPDGDPIPGFTLAGFDDGAVQVTPEPATLSLVALGLLGLFARRRAGA